MTNVTSSVDVVSRFTWRVPCDYSPGVGYNTVIGDLATAWDFARTEAKRQGINVDCDDWAHVSPGDEDVTIFFVVDAKGKPTVANDTELSKLRDTIAVRATGEEIRTVVDELAKRLPKMAEALSREDMNAAVYIMLDVLNRGRTA